MVIRRSEPGEVTPNAALGSPPSSFVRVRDGGGGGNKGLALLDSSQESQPNFKPEICSDDLRTT